MKKLKRISEIDPIEGFSRVETALIRENEINLENFKEIFPDYKSEGESLPWVIKNLSKLKKEKEFTDYILKNSSKKFCIIGDYDK